MSFSFEIKKDLSNINNFKDKRSIECELFGFLITGNTIKNEDHYRYSTENEFIIERLYKILFNLGYDYEPEIDGKMYIARISRKVDEILKFENELKESEEKAVVRGAFLGAGNIENPEVGYHVDISFYEISNCDFLLNICKKYNIHFKTMQNKGRYRLYLKDSEEISRFLALIESHKGVLAFEDIRLTKEIKNNVNRKVNCETSNLNKTINATIDQINDIKLIKKLKKFDKLSDELQKIANLRLENPDASLKALGELLDEPVGKSGVSHRLKKIHDYAEELRKGK